MAAVNVLLLSFHYPPMETTGALRPARLIRHLPPDIEVTVLTPGETTNAPPVRRGWRRLVGIAGSLLPRTDRFGPAARRVGRSAVAAARSTTFDVIWCTTPPHSFQLVAMRLGRRWGRPVVADLRDPWSGNFMRRSPTRVHGWLERRRERAVLHRAALVVANTPGNRRELLARFPELGPDRVVVLPNGFDPDLVARLTPAADRRGEGPLTLLHLGTVYAAEGPGLEAVAAAVTRDTAWNVRFVGEIDPGSAATFDALVAANRAEVRDRVPYAYVPGEIEAADALLCLVPPQASTTVPSKLYEALASGRPVVLIASEGDAAEVAARTGGAVVVPYATAAVMTAAVAAALDEIRTGRGSRPVDRTALSAFDARVQSAQLATWLRGLAERPPRDRGP